MTTLWWAGCFFTTSGGLRSFEHPFNELKAVPRVDSSGEMCGANFKVDAGSRKEAGMPRVGSAANWSQHYWSKITPFLFAFLPNLRPFRRVLRDLCNILPQTLCGMFILLLVTCISSLNNYVWRSGEKVGN